MYWKIHPEMLDEIRAGGTPHMPISEQLLVSLMGIATVFLCLIVLALAIMLVSKLIGGLGIGEKKAAAAPAAAAAAPAPAMDEEGMAVVMAAVCEETGLPIDRIRIKNVQELK